MVWRGERMRERALPTGPEQFLQYFEDAARESDDPHWRNGVETCTRWLALTDGLVTQTEIDQLIARLDAEPDPGTGWVDLDLQFRAWARDRGFTA